MRIGFDVGPITASRTGVGTYCYYLLKHMMSLESGDEFVGFSSGLAPVMLDGLEGQLHHRHLGLPTRLLYQLWSAVKRPRVDKLLGGVDVYHATNYFLPPTERARRVVTIHDLCFLVHPELCSPKIVRPFSRGVRRFVHEADAVVVYSDSTRTDVVKHLNVAPERVHIAPLGPGEDLAPVDQRIAGRRLQEQYGIDSPFILFVGTLEPRKNVEVVLAAFRQLVKHVPHCLVLLGQPGWGAEGIEKALAQPELAHRVIQPGYVPREDLSLFYSGADVFVFPSLYEGFGLPLLEAMTCGCPVVTSRNSSIPEVVGNAAIKIDARDDEGLARSIRAVLDDPALRTAMEIEGLAQARRFSWRECARKTLDVYRSVA